MNDELTKKLISKYPVLFSGVDKSPMENLMCFGIECGPGWYQILDALCIMISGGHTGWCNADKDQCWPIRLWNRLVDKLGKWKWRVHRSIRYHTPKFEFMQIKEKYGTLRVYLGSPVFDDEFTKNMERYPKTMREVMDRWQREVDGAIQLAEDLSSITCEDCGKPGELCQRGIWVSTMCPECRTSKNNEGYEPCNYTKDDEDAPCIQ